MTEFGLDVIGDVHGSLAPLQGLLGDLGYAREAGYAHPERRTLVFLGDLIDRGPRSLDSAAFVMDLCAGRRAHCLMGNHEYNLLTTHLLGRAPRSSNRRTCAEIARDPRAWRPVKEPADWTPLMRSIRERVQAAAGPFESARLFAAAPA